MIGLTFQVTFNHPSKGKGEPASFFGYNEGPKTKTNNKHLQAGHSLFASISPPLINSKKRLKITVKKTEAQCQNFCIWSSFVCITSFVEITRQSDHAEIIGSGS